MLNYKPVVLIIFLFHAQFAIHMAMAMIMLSCLILGSIYSGQFGKIRQGKYASLAQNLHVDIERLQNQIDVLAGFSDTPAPSVTRILYTQNDVAARRYVKNLMELAGLEVREDAIGNIFGRWEGTETAAGAVASGSHTDAIPYAGKYDGVVGVLGAIEAIQALRSAGFQPKRSLEVIMFTSEEPTRFGIGCLGSRMLADVHFADVLRTAMDKDNISFVQAAHRAGYMDADKDLGTVAIPKGAYSSFIELHIEQGPILEDEGIPVGIVTAIAGPATIRVEFKGDGGHAGAVLMPFRNDAGLAAAELALAVEKHVLESGSIDTVGTTGILEVHPGAVNSIPRQARLEIDIRDIDYDRRNLIIDQIDASAKKIASKRHVGIANFAIINQDPPAQSADFVIQAALLSSKQLNLTHKLMISRAYHDSLFMARLIPTSMIFIPCYKGYSHRPDEYASRDNIENGVRVLALTLATLSEYESVVPEY